MGDIDDIIEQLLGSRRISESATFSTRTFADQPIIERGSDLKARIEEREARRAQRRQQEAQRRDQERQQAREHQKHAAKTDHPLARSSDKASGQPQLPLQNSAAIGDQLFDTGDSYRDELIADDAQNASSPAPKRTLSRDEEALQRIADMRALEASERVSSYRSPGSAYALGYGSGVAAKLFYQQARLMEDFEDDHPYQGAFLQYWPTYASMSDRQLRGYFTWRTRLRAGTMEPAPLAFAFVYTYELLMGIGTTPGAQAMRDLRELSVSYAQVSDYEGLRLRSYLHRWLFDYAIYHQLTDELNKIPEDTVGAAALTLLRAEHARLAQTDRQPRIPNDAAQGTPPTDEELLQALGSCASYHLNESRLAKDEPELLAQVARDVFDAYVDHCSRRRKTDLVEGLFGYAGREPHTIFAGAVFYDEDPPEELTVRINEVEAYVCRNGRWFYERPIGAFERNKELGIILHTIDYELREQLDYRYPLKRRKVPPKFVQRLVQQAIAKRLEERAEAERRRIVIDRSKLRDIRAAAAVTQEALLTDEERGELPEMTPASPAVAPAPSAAAARTAPLSPDASGTPAEATAEMPAQAAPAVSEMSPAAATTDAVPAEGGLLTPLEERLVCGLMDDVPLDQLLGPHDPFVSVVADSINEKLFDLVGDTVIEDDGSGYHLVEDYLDDIREVLSS